MLNTFKGTYNNGQVILEEAPPETNGPTEVLVTFTEPITVPKTKKKTVFGYAKGTVLYMSPDFNEPLDDLKDYM